MRKFDIAMLCTALVVLVCALVFYPVKKINFGQTTLVFSQWLKEDMPEEVVAKVIAEFEESHPAIRIVLEDMIYEDVRHEISGYLEAFRNEKSNDGKNGRHRPPDIILIDPLWLNDSEKQTLFLDQNALGTPGVAEKVYSTPLYSYFNVLFYNIDILEEAGFDRPPGTRGEFEAVCSELKKKNIYGLSVGEDFFAGIFPWIWSVGGGSEGFDIQKDTFDFTGRAVVESFGFLDRLNRQNMLGRPPFINNEDEKVKNFVAGKTAMITASSRLIKYFQAERNSVRFDITAVPYPENNPARPVFGINGVHIAVLSSSGRKEAALEFIRFLETKKTELAAAAGAVPTGVPLAVFDGEENAGPREAEPYDVASDNPVYAKARSIFESADSVEGWKVFSDCAALGVLASEETDLMFRSNRSAADTAAAIQKRYAAAVN
jgi:multiple sugar transport system substrate-binding protein